ncbi:MAG: vitamin K epoxide reductase family protein [Desulfobacterales bacterium]|jgi:protein-disulfide isomerase/uncharacterized membrane protein
MAKSSKVKKKIEVAKKEPGIIRDGWFVVILGAVGLGLCLYLYSFHIELLMGEIKSGPLCGVDNGLGCHSVATGPYSIMMGLPLAIWGAVFFSTLALLGAGGLIFWRDCGMVFLRWAFWLAALGLAFDLYLAYTMIYRIQAVCWLCVATYGINFIIIVVLLIRILQEPKPRISFRAIFPGMENPEGIDPYFRNVVKGLLLGGILLAAGIGIAGSQFLSKSLTEYDRELLAKSIKNFSQQKPILIESKNRPVRGADDADITVVEFSDFLCPFCATASKYIKLAGSSTHDTVRFVFRHYPLDKSCNWRMRSDLHPGACLLAEGAACAFEQNRFWEYHDIAFETKGSISRSVVMDTASKIGLNLGEFKSCLDSGRGLKAVKEDIQAAYDADVKGTPTLFINGRRLGGVPKPWMLIEFLQYSQKHLAPSK